MTPAQKMHAIQTVSLPNTGAEISPHADPALANGHKRAFHSSAGCELSDPTHIEEPVEGISFMKKIQAFTPMMAIFAPCCSLCRVT